jgi:hypothetical protein
VTLVQALSAIDLLGLWDRGQGRAPPEQALLLLAAAHGEQATTDPAALSIGRRNTLLLQLRRSTLGDALECRASCPACGEQLEFAASVGDLLLADTAIANEEYFAARAGEVTATMRLPNSEDLLAAGRCADAAAARRVLLQRCVLEAQLGGDPLEVGALPEEVVAALAAEAAARDPQAELLIAMVCPACEAGWQAPFDIAAFFWQELTVHAERLLREVHLLARRYGWREADILSMSARRRQRYLELIEGD